MLRVLIAGILAASSLAACSKEKTDAPVAVGKPAGKVVELTGKVTATREGKPRDLAMGAEVFADDQIETAADATVTIELFHNNAKWAVVSNKKSRVDASLAWGLDKQAATKPVDHNSAAAGRNAERSAADTASTTSTPSAGAAAPEAAPMVEKKESNDEAVPPPPPPPPPPAIETRGGKGAPGGPMRDKPAKTTAGELQRNEKGFAESNPLQLKLKEKQAELTKCLSPQNPNVTLTVVVKAGKATITLGGDGNITDKVRSCMDVVVQKIKFDADGTAKLSFR